MKDTPQNLAAYMLGAGINASGLLHFSLYNAITIAESLTNRAGGVLFSRQAIAAIIVAWKLANPDLEAVPHER